MKDFIMQDKMTINDKGEWHGMWETYHDNGRLKHKGLWINGKKFGLHEYYFKNGELNYKANFINDEHYGYLENHFTHKTYKQYYAR
jgi:antitoxin component YwqK of YwqJK toxin-antitoxin module